MAPLTSPIWRTTRAGPSLRMPGAGNTVACRVPGPGKPGRRFVNFVFVRLHILSAGNTDAGLRPRCVPGLANPPRCVVNIILFPAHHYFDTTAPMTNSAPPCACGSTATSSIPATPTRHRPWHSSHDYLDHGYTTYALGYLDKRHKGLPPCLSNLVGFHSSHDFRDASTIMTVGGVHRLAF